MFTDGGWGTVCRNVVSVSSAIAGPKKEGLRTKMDTTLMSIIAVAVLYNFDKRQENKLSEEAEVDLPEENEEDGQVQHDANANGNVVRRTLIENHFAT